MRVLLPFVIATLSLPAQVSAAQPIAVPQFRSVELSAGGDLSIVRGPVQRVTLLNGSTDLTSFRVMRDGRLEISTHCDRRCPREYNLRIQIESPTVPDIAVEAGGTIRVAPGFAPQRQLSAAINAGGTIDARAVPASEVSAAVNAGGDIYVRPSERLSAAVHAGGDIHYSGNPQVSMAVSGGGDVRPD